MDGDDMRRGNDFFRKHQYKIAAVCVLAAVLGITGAYMYTGSGFVEEAPQQQVAEKDTEEVQKATQKATAKQEEKPDKKAEKAKEEKQETAKVSAVIPPQKKIADVKNDAVQTEEPKEQPKQPETVETANMEPAVSTELHFSADTGLLWPVSGSVILDYSMDQTVYFATLDQYKYNPAVIISGNVNDQVKAAANGKITDISNNEVTGTTVTMDLGDGYTAIYGQLKEVPYEPGAYLEAGNSLGFVSEPTKYYSLEGSNLYFAMEKDGAPIDPVEFFQ